MPEIAPFRGIRYTGPRPAAAVAPPYDVIEPPLHRRLLLHHPAHAVRLTLGETPDRPRGLEPEYRQRGEALRRWLREGVLTRDATPSLYSYRLTFPGLDGAPRHYRGLFGVVPALPWGTGGVYPHEEVRPKVVDDRFLLCRATASQLGVVQLVIDGRDGEWQRLLESASGTNVLTGEDATGLGHQVDAIRDPETLGVLRAWLRDQKSVVADGHHRYTSAMRLREETDFPGRQGCLVMVGDLFQEGLEIYPTHRLLSWETPGDCQPRAVVDHLVSQLDDGDGPEWSLETGDQRVPLRSRCDREVPTLARRLQQALSTLPGPAPTIDTFHDEETMRTYRADVSGPQVSCWLPAVGKEEFWERASNGEVFPPKTTYFLPKIYTGLVARTLDEPGDATEGAGA